MYGTVARFRVKPGMEARLQELMKDEEMVNIPGYIGATVYRLDSGSDEYIMAVVFKDKDAYFKNANDPAQDKRYEDFRAQLQDDPQWMDGEIVYSFNKA